MGGSFGGMMLRHAERINGTAILRENSEYEKGNIGTKAKQMKSLSKSGRKLLASLDEEFERIKHTLRRRNFEAVSEFSFKARHPNFLKAGLVKNGDTVSTILDRLIVTLEKENTVAKKIAEPVPEEYTAANVQTIRDNVVNCIAEQMGLNFDEVKDIRNREEIGIDSLDSIEIVMRFEEAFELEIYDDDYEKWKTIDDIVAYLMHRRIRADKHDLTSKRIGVSRAVSNVRVPNTSFENVPETDLIAVELRNVKELFNTSYMKQGMHEFEQRFNDLFMSGAENIVASVVQPKTVGECDGWHIDLSGRIGEDDAGAINRLLTDAGFDCVSVTDHVRVPTESECLGAFRNAARVFSRIYFTLVLED